MIIIPGELVQDKTDMTESASVTFTAREAEDVYSLLGVNDRSPNVPGTVLVSKKISCLRVRDIGDPFDRVRVLIRVQAHTNEPSKCCFETRGFVLKEDKWIRDEVVLVPIKEQLFSRLGGLLETDKLADKRVLIAGQGSGGAPIGVGLVQSGVMDLALVDHDRLEVCNIMRHVLGLSQVGRYKTKAMADYLRDKNPHLNVGSLEEKIGWDNIESLRALVREVDLVICATGDRTSKRVLNRLCVQEGKVLIIGGAFRRAYGGSILRVRPGESVCYQCILQSFPEEDEEISNPEEAEGLAYTDRPVPIEPGLATDILPISTMVVKLAIQELLRGTETTLRSLDDDLVASLYLWGNRREGQFENTKPLAFNIRDMSPLRWYGVKIARHLACEECGDFVGALSKKHDFTLTGSDLEVFDSNGNEG